MYLYIYMSTQTDTHIKPNKMKETDEILNSFCSITITMVSLTLFLNLLTVATIDNFLSFLDLVE